MSLALCALLAGRIQAEDVNDLDDQKESAVTIVLTKFDVNDQSLELNYKIKNDSDHDVWVCDSINALGKFDFECFLAKDAKTLVIRKRFDLREDPLLVRDMPSVLAGRFVRLRAGEERTEFFSDTVPVRPFTLYENDKAYVEYANASRLVLEIGFYDEDLPGMILHIVEIVEKLGCEIDWKVLSWDDREIITRYFGGFVIESAFNRNAYFSDSVKEGEQVTIPYMWPVLRGEKILRWTVDGVSIPYKEYGPVPSHEGKRTTDQQRKQASSPDKKKPDNKKGSDHNNAEVG